MKQKTAVVALRSAIILDAADGQISSAGILNGLPVDFALADNGASDGSQNVCKDGLDGAQATSLMSWYVFLPACVQAKQILPAAAAPRAAAPYQLQFAASGDRTASAISSLGNAGAFFMAGSLRGQHRAVKPLMDQGLWKLPSPFCLQELLQCGEHFFWLAAAIDQRSIRTVLS